MIYITSTLLLLLSTYQTIAQNLIPENGFAFQDNTVARIDILLESDSLNAILAPGNEESFHEYPATFVYTSAALVDTVYNVGFRLRGNTSRNADKKSFKVAFNSFENKKFQGLEKMNLNGEHNDPSIIRSKLAWDIFRLMEVPGSRSSHVKLYINNEYRGLYINVEHVDEEFVDLRFGNKDGNLYKCLWPADLNYINSDPNSYKMSDNGRRTYDLKTNTSADDYSDLANFITIINNEPIATLPEALEPIFNVDSYLRFLVVETFTGHWDSYSVNKNNFYLYNNTATGKMEFTPYDMDNTYGIDWFGINWATRDINNWWNEWEDRPLTERILQVPEYSARYNFYFSKLLNEITNPSIYFPQIDAMKNMISPHVANDSYHSQDYGWDYNDFSDSYTDDLGGHVTYGLKPYIQARYSAATSQLDLQNIAPILRNVTNNTPGSNQLIRIRATIEDDDTVSDAKLFWQLNGSAWDSIAIFDDGTHNDLANADQIYANTFGPINQAGHINYYIKATDNTNLTSRAPLNGYYSFFVFNTANIPLYINEYMASNDNSISDNAGEHDDWIELYNGGSNDIYLGDKYLSDNYDAPQKWNLPNETLAAGAFKLFWADGDTLQGLNHASFKLSAGGEEILLSWNDNGSLKVVDHLIFGNQRTDFTEGRYPDGIGPVIELSNPTPGYSNILHSVEEEMVTMQAITAYPNPSSGQVTVHSGVFAEGQFELNVFDQMGHLINTVHATTNTINIDLSEQAAGLYLILVTGVDKNQLPLKEHLKIIKY